MVSKAMENAVSKIYEQIATDGKITDNQLALIMLYEKKQNKKPSNINFDTILKNGQKVIKIINDNLQNTKE